MPTAAPTDPANPLTPAPQAITLPELLAPAGNWDCAKAAVENGADAIYFGLEQFNARMRADNFTLADLPQLMAWLHQRGVKGYVTLNTLIFTAELAEVEAYLRSIITAGVDAAIVQDIGLCRLIRHLSADFPIHGSTQMTVTSAAGVEFARNLGCNLVVLARECSIKEIEKIQSHLHRPEHASTTALPLEVFVHGALCVAYSGQCLTSEALGGRSANRGECAQACRMPYDLVVDGQELDLGQRRYLLSPQDLAGLAVLPELVKTGVVSLKIEGRLKTPEYVASITQIYRQALDRLGGEEGLSPISPSDQYRMEMAFSRGLSTGWLQGIDNQTLVHAEFGKKRGVYLGQVVRVINGRDPQVLLDPETAEIPLKPGDGVVFDNGHPDKSEVGGRLYGVSQQGQQTLLTFGRHDMDLRRVRPGDRLWKTSDPALSQQIRQTFHQEQPQYQRPITLTVLGQVGEPLTLIAQAQTGQMVQAASAIPLTAAEQQGLTSERLQAQLARLGNTPFCLGQFHNHLQGEVWLPVSELNRLRRQVVEELELLLAQPLPWQLQADTTYRELLPVLPQPQPNPGRAHQNQPELVVLVRSLEQFTAVLSSSIISTIYCEFEDPRAYRQAVQQARQSGTTTQVWLAPPRIYKPGENYILEQVQAAQADGILVRNYDHLQFFQGLPQRGDFSFNVANPLTVAHLKALGLERLTASYDLNASQLADLLRATPPDWLEITIHQHMPMFHMEHCVFCAFLSEGKDFRDCGRPCESYEVKLRDRAGVEHVLRADAGCRNTVFNGTAQTGAEYVQQLLQLGVRHLRLEFVDETVPQIQDTIQCYQQLLLGQITGAQLWRRLSLQSQLGVTRGALESR
jgi:U32 family peptidase